MSIANDVPIRAIRHIFRANAPRHRGPIEARSLYRLWRESGLRRDDLSAAIRAMVDAGELRAEHESGRWQYFLVKRENIKEASGDASEQLSAAITAARTSAGGDRFENPAYRSRDRRRTDVPDGASPRERRRTPNNRLIASLPEAAREKLTRHLELVPMPPGLVLWNEGDAVNHFYFPIDCIVSLSIEMMDDVPVEVSCIGNEGVVDAMLLMGGRFAARRATVEIPGYAYRMPAGVLMETFDTDPIIRAHFLRYVRAIVMHMGQINACSQRHSIRQRLSRLLLSILDSTRSPVVATTHDRLAGMIGVRREGVTEEIGRLKLEGLVSGERGSLVVHDRKELEKRSCDCYILIRDEFDLLRSSKIATLNKKAAQKVGGAEHRDEGMDLSEPIIHREAAGRPRGC